MLSLLLIKGQIIATQMFHHMLLMILFLLF
jgi:hypothetical protein